MTSHVRYSSTFYCYLHFACFDKLLFESSKNEKKKKERDDLTDFYNTFGYVY